MFSHCFENHFDLCSFKVNISDALVFAFILRLLVCLLVIQPIDLLWRFRQLMSHIKASTMKLERQKRSLNLGFALISKKVYAQFLSKKTSFELWGTTYVILIKNIVFFTYGCKGKNLYVYSFIKKSFYIFCPVWLCDFFNTTEH